MKGFIEKSRIGAMLLLLIALNLPLANAQNVARRTSLLKGLKGPPKLDIASTAVVEKEPTAWDKSILFGFNYTEGNSNTTSINLNGKASRELEASSWRFEADYNHANAAAEPREKRETTKDNLRVNGEYRKIISNTYFSGLGSSYTYDSIADVDYRSIVSPSVGAFLYRKDKSSVSLEGGPSYVWESLGGIGDDYPALRVANRIVVRLTDTSLMYQSGEFLLSLSDNDNYLLNAEVGIEAAVVSNISLSFSIRDYYINQPAGGRRPNDVYTITALKLMF